MGIERVPQEVEGLSLTIAVGVNNRKLLITPLMLALNSATHQHCQDFSNVE